ncbi:GNAT family N-acetyltransferase [Pseudomonas sp. NBRC 111119]|uniref:GNAT family N-acetyltransferase n=1 Tax=Pseudomonas sp. NBRC 111119 TaxID=1661034 RepID=UPI0035277D01
MWIAPEARGLGIGRALLESAVAWAENRGTFRVRLDVTIADSPAIQLYKTSGFEPVGPAEPLRPGSSLMSQPMELRLRADQLR